MSKPIIHAKDHWAGGPDPAATAWVTTTSLSGSWAGTVLYRLDGNGDPELDGDVSGGTYGGALFTLPTYYRPVRDAHRVGWVSASGVLAQVDIDSSNGVVTINRVSSSGGTTSSSTVVAASNVTYGGSTDLSSSNVEDALDELDSEKAPKTVTLTAGSGLAGGGDLSANRTFSVNVDDSTIQISSDTLRVKAAGILASHIGDPELSAFAGVTSAADKVFYFTGSGGGSVTDFSSFARTLVDDTTASTARNTLGVVASLFQSGGAQVIALDTLGVPTDITTLNSSTSQHGLLPKLSGSSSEFLRGDGAWATTGAGGSGGTIANVQVFNVGTAQTWTKPTGASIVEVICIGAGGGGGGGPSSVNTAKGGGAGGGGGSVVKATLRASDISGGTVTVDVGTGGTGGSAGSAGAGAAGGNGNDASGPTTFGSYVKAYGGGGGRGGTSSSVTGGGGASMGHAATDITAGVPSSSTNAIGGQAGASVSGNDGVNSEYGGAGGAGSATASSRVGGSSVYGGPGGGMGGRVSAGNAATAGGAGGGTMSYTEGSGTAAGTAGASPTTPSAGAFTGPYCGAGGGGGGSGSTGVAGANGGDGGTGAGGGGGGAGSNSSSGSNAGGTGGNGGDGRCIIITYF